MPMRERDKITIERRPPREPRDRRQHRRRQSGSRRTHQCGAQARDGTHRCRRGCRHRHGRSWRRFWRAASRRAALARSRCRCPGSTFGHPERRPHGARRPRRLLRQRAERRPDRLDGGKLGQHRAFQPLDGGRFRKARRASTPPARGRSDCEAAIRVGVALGGPMTPTRLASLGDLPLSGGGKLAAPPGTTTTLSASATLSPASSAFASSSSRIAGGTWPAARPRFAPQRRRRRQRPPPAPSPLPVSASPAAGRAAAARACAAPGVSPGDPVQTPARRRGRPPSSGSLRGVSSNRRRTCASSAAV